MCASIKTISSVELIRTITRQSISDSLDKRYRHKTTGTAPVIPPLFSAGHHLFLHLPSCLRTFRRLTPVKLMGWRVQVYIYLWYGFVFGGRQNEARTTGGNSGAEKYVPTTSVHLHWHFNDTSSGVHLIIRLQSTIFYTG